MNLRVESLSEHPGLIDTVIGWHWHEFSAGHSDASLAHWRAQLVERSNRDRIPFTLIAFADDEPVGCVTVCTDDLDSRFADRGPWLSGMLVVNAARNLGIGRALLRAVADRARELGADELWLRTETAPSFYERCGWSTVARREQMHDSTVMRLATGASRD